VDAEVVQDLVVRARWVTHPRLDPGALGGPFAEISTALFREPDQGRVGLALDDKADRPTATIEPEEGQL